MAVNGTIPFRGIVALLSLLLFHCVQKADSGSDDITPQEGCRIYPVSYNLPAYQSASTYTQSCGFDTSSLTYSCNSGATNVRKYVNVNSFVEETEVFGQKKLVSDSGNNSTSANTYHYENNRLVSVVNSYYSPSSYMGVFYYTTVFTEWDSKGRPTKSQAGTVNFYDEKNRTVTFNGSTVQYDQYGNEIVTGWSSVKYRKLCKEAAGSRYTAKVSVTNAVNFGNVARDGSGVSTVVVIRNDGGAPASLTGSPIVRIVGPDAAEFQIDTSETISILPPGNESHFNVIFNPVSLGDKSAQLEIMTSGSETPLIVTLAGHGGVGQLSVLKDNVILTGADPIDFGILIRGDKNTQNFSLANTGDAEIQIGSVTFVVSDSTAGCFRMTANIANAQLAPGSKLDFQVEFAPTLICRAYRLGLMTAKMQVSFSTNFDKNISIPLGAPVQVTVPLTGTLKSKLQNPRNLVTGIQHACVLDDSGVSCWGNNASYVPALTNPRKIFAGGAYTCALDDTGLVCWSPYSYSTFPLNYGGSPINPLPNLRNPSAISINYLNYCAIDDTGLVCWGPQRNATNTPEAVNPQAVVVGYDAVFARDQNGLVCMDRFSSTGVCNYFQPLGIDLDNFIISSTSGHYCGLTNQGVICVKVQGYYSLQQMIVPALNNPKKLGMWAYVTEFYACALDDNGANCWNGSGALKATPNLVNPSSITVSQNAACALDDSGVVCWVVDPDDPNYSSKPTYMLAIP